MHPLLSLNTEPTKRDMDFITVTSITCGVETGVFKEQDTNIFGLSYMLEHIQLIPKEPIINSICSGY